MTGDPPALEELLSSGGDKWFLITTGVRKEIKQGKGMHYASERGRESDLSWVVRKALLQEVTLGQRPEG